MTEGPDDDPEPDDEDLDEEIDDLWERRPYASRWTPPQEDEEADE